MILIKKEFITVHHIIYFNKHLIFFFLILVFCLNLNLSNSLNLLCRKLYHNDITCMYYNISYHFDLLKYLGKMIHFMIYIQLIINMK